MYFQKIKRLNQFFSFACRKARKSQLPGKVKRSLYNRTALRFCSGNSSFSAFSIKLETLSAAPSCFCEVCSFFPIQKYNLTTQKKHRTFMQAFFWRNTENSGSTHRKIVRNIHQNRRICLKGNIFGTILWWPSRWNKLALSIYDLTR